MSMGLIVFLFILFIITMLLTIYAFRQEEKKMKKYEEEGSTVEDELKRSHEYENTSVKKYLPIQIWIYLITIILTVIIIAFYIY